MAISSGPISRTMWIGLSTDTKPSAGVEFSAQFYEYDTGKTYIWTGTGTFSVPVAGQWVEYLPLYPADFLQAVNQPLS